MLAHKFVAQSMESDLYLKKQSAKKSWWSFGWWTSLDPVTCCCLYIPIVGFSFLFWCFFLYLYRGSQSTKDENEPGNLTEEDWERLNNIIGFREGNNEQLLAVHGSHVLHTSLEIHMKHNASKLTDMKECLADLSCDDLECFVNLYSEAKAFDVKLGSYRLSSPNGLLAAVRLFWFAFWISLFSLSSSSLYRALVTCFCFTFLLPWQWCSLIHRVQLSMIL